MSESSGSSGSALGHGARGRLPVPPGWELAKGLSSRLGDRLGRQRALIEEGQLLLILHEVPAPGDAEREAVAFWRDGSGGWHGSQGGPALIVMARLLDAYDTAIDGLEQAYRDARTARAYFQILEHALPIDRAARNLYATLQTARESLHDVRELIVMRDRAAEIQRAAELLHADVRNAMDFCIARQAEQQAESASVMAAAGHRLNRIAGLFFPLTALGSMFGMNMATGLEAAPVWVFWAVFAVGILLGGVLSASLRRAPVATAR